VFAADAGRIGGQLVGDAGAVLEPLTMMRPSRGFTAIELMVVVSVIATLLAVAVPSFQEQLARRKLEGAATELSTDIHFARTQAVSRNAPVSVTTTAAGYIVADGATTFKTVTLDPTLSLTSGITLTYDPMRGLANAVALDLASSRTGAQMRVRTNAMGRVTLCTPGGSLKGYTTCS
jgi:type IV fimbrial biogenesis protein FimT